jgi:hypothetical protein
MNIITLPEIEFTDDNANQLRTTIEYAVNEDIIMIVAANKNNFISLGYFS